MARRDLPWFRIAAVGALVAAVVGVVLVVRSGSRIPDTRQPIDWNRQTCGHCQMLVGEPHHASQLITGAGDVLSFDDPGCALRYLDQHHPTIHRMWFHHGTEDRWLTVEEVAFLTGAVTPMGSGLSAVDLGSPGAVDVPAARAAALAPRPPPGHGPATAEVPR